jgi:hypothetical protein
VVLDFFSRKILGYAFSDSLESGIVIEAFLKAYKSHGKLDSMTGDVSIYLIGMLIYFAV